jgi:hypothetical protein
MVFVETDEKALCKPDSEQYTGVDRAEAPDHRSNRRKLEYYVIPIVGLLGGIGSFLSNISITRSRPLRISKKDVPAALGLVPRFDDNKDNLPWNMSLTDSTNPISEAYRSIRTFLLLSTEETRAMITSLRDEEDDYCYQYSHNLTCRCKGRNYRRRHEKGETA